MLKHKIKKPTRTQIDMQSPMRPMPAKTKNFIQKICYRRTASVDMTRYGFINDSKMHPINLMMKPLQDKLKTICGSITSLTPRPKSQIRRRGKVKELQRPAAVATVADQKRFSSSKGSSVSKTKKSPKQAASKS